MEWKPALKVSRTRSFVYHNLVNLNGSLTRDWLSMKSFPFPHFKFIEEPELWYYSNKSRIGNATKKTQISPKRSNIPKLQNEKFFQHSHFLWCSKWLFICQRHTGLFIILLRIFSSTPFKKEYLNTKPVIEQSMQQRLLHTKNVSHDTNKY